MDTEVASPLDSCDKTSRCSPHTSPLTSPLTSTNFVNVSPSPEKSAAAAVKSTGKENNFPDFSSFYHSLISEHIIPTSPLSTSTSPPSAADESSLATENRLYQARLVIESHLYQDLLNRYGIALNQIHDLSNETTSLLEENDMLRLANEELTRRLSCLLQYLSKTALLQSRLGAATSSSSSSSVLSLAEDLQRNSIGSMTSREINRELRSGPGYSSNNSPTSVIDRKDGSDSSGVERVCLPKSISVRSSGYLKMNPPAAGNINAGPVPNPAPAPAPGRSRVPSQLMDAARVYVKREEKAVEMEVYNQGMYKTELCNKWQETGACPYGDQCQFAHGLSELRPVIRHPRYKTEVCRMVVAGVSCPYGHRCHFRHSLSDREKLMGQHS
ncbi:hypothetical protein Droror1_Dr00016072 [Drosera rotundifolia]